MEISDDGGDGPEAICVNFKLHRRGEGVLFEKQMCGPLLSERTSESIECSIPLMPPAELFVLCIAPILIVVQLALSIYLQCKAYVKWQRKYVCVGFCGSIIFFALQAVFIVEVAA